MVAYTNKPSKGGKVKETSTAPKKETKKSNKSEKSDK
jgi:hypothetical protein